MFSKRKLPLLVATLALVSLFGSPVAALAQTAARSLSGTDAFESSGIKAFITNITKSDRGFSVQMEIENLRKNTIYIAPIGAKMPGGGNTALAASGKEYMIAEQGRALIGMDPCWNGNNGLFAAAISGCVASFPIESMTTIEPSHKAVVGASYDGPGDPGAYVTFALKFLVRDAPPEADAPSLKSEKVQVAGPVKVVTLSFSLLPFADSK